VLYVLEVKLLLAASQRNGETLEDPNFIDVYRETFGFRTVTTSPDGLFVNGKRFYCMGAGMHEDGEIVGRGFSYPLAVKDLNLMGKKSFPAIH
jgi:beta-galactosidase/beta-glucuronidase